MSDHETLDLLLRGRERDLAASARETTRTISSSY
jgi:hypothetical protein